MNIRGFAEPQHADRKVVDVIWFPTGGGKTEAYLGLAAFVILLRRLKKSEDAGTTVLMRYTLRLLTTQQFQRAASLICALERIRRAEPQRFGFVPITIGLWLGGAVTPNRHSDAVQQYSRLSREGGASPFIILACPWCGAQMGAQRYGAVTRVFGYKLEKRPGTDGRVRFVCDDAACDFSGPAGLPLEVVDEGIYERPPTLVIGTVDKFAMMPWEPRSRSLFGIDNPETAGPPSLIIQDELHLISGPLGSMVGHYETVIDEFTTHPKTKIPAKIVASTATIARAEEQIKNVYGRKAKLFPPQGLVAGESFFAFEGEDRLPAAHTSAMLATALPSHVTAQKVVLATLLQATALVDGPDGAVDPYWTLMVYFNSLRELGRASTLVQADIREHLNSLWDRIGLMEAMLPGSKPLRRFINNFDELTSRLRSSDIPAILQKLFNPKGKDVVDLCYATNMIQVGLDVPRLSLMCVVGQPKGASEYIQASSRVGRGKGTPGLVVTNYNPFKPRDRSHFESFRSFHENAYKFVEATSVTPFSIPVCERAIHALAVSLARFRYPELRDSPVRGVAARRADIVRTIVERIKIVAPDELGRATAILDRFLNDWERRKPQSYGGHIRWPAGRPSALARGKADPPRYRVPRSESEADTLVDAERRCGMRCRANSSLRTGGDDVKPAWKTKKGAFGARKSPPPARPVRRAQLIAPFGIGSMNDFRNDEALMCAGLDNWFITLPEQALRIQEERLAARLNREFFVRPPEFSEEAGPKYKIPHVRFPLWHYCPRCFRMKRTTLFGGQPLCEEKTCSRSGRGRRMIPVRIVTACESGHIEDFPFRKWIGCTCASDVDAEMYFKAGRSAASLAGIKIECTKCKQKRSLAGAFEKESLSAVNATCSGAQPWLGREVGLESCGAGLQTVQRGSSNVYFPAVQSSIYIPPAHARGSDSIRTCSTTRSSGRCSLPGWWMERSTRSSGT